LYKPVLVAVIYDGVGNLTRELKNMFVGIIAAMFRDLNYI
jgi:hypothetical protein